MHEDYAMLSMYSIISDKFERESKFTNHRDFHINSFFRTIRALSIDQTYIDRKNEVIKAERRLLKELGFCVYVKHPHKVISSISSLIFLN